jgi:hypothetical protein
MNIFRKLPTTYAPVLALGASLMGGGNAAADTVIPDDLIVQGSTCVGFDCVNNENFGFDTIKLKENNLRIFFEDTSTSPGFPPNDWRLIANDSASGGSNFFAIEDATAARQVFRVDAGAPANSLRVTSTGNVGIGTATPVLDLSMNTNDTPAMRLEQNNSGGFGAQTWDVAGNEANFFVRDVTNGSLLSFRIRPGAPTSSLDIASNGNVGIGTATPGAAMTVAKGLLQATGTTVPTSGVGVELGVAGAEGLMSSMDRGTNAFRALRLNAALHRFEIANNEVMRISGGGNLALGTTAPSAQLHTTGSVRFGGITGCSGGLQTDGVGNVSCLDSSRQFKNVAGELKPEVALANVMALRPHVGAYKDTPDVPEHWLIAEDVAKVDPALVGLRDGEPYTVKMQNVVADLIAVIQQQQRRIEALERALAR